MSLADMQIDLTKIFSEYSKEISDGVLKAQDEVAEKVLADLKSSSPKRKGKYARGWTIKRENKKVKIYNAKSPGLTHLLEFGHAKKNGGRTRAIPHIKPAEEKAKTLFLKAVKDVVENAK